MLGKYQLKLRGIPGFHAWIPHIDDNIFFCRRRDAQRLTSHQSAQGQPAVLLRRDIRVHLDHLSKPLCGQQRLCRIQLLLLRA